MSNFPWLKLWNEAPDDPKWLAVAEMAGSSRPVVWYAFSKALTHANQNDNRGSISGLHPQVIASWCQVPVAEINRILQAFRDLGILIGDRIAKWAKRQTEKIAKPRSAAAERQARLRAKRAAAAAQGTFAFDAEPVTPPAAASQTGVTSVAEEEVDDSEAVASELIVRPTTAEFEEFWARYPRRVGKGLARKAYDRARKIATWPEIMSGVLRYAAECADRPPQFIKHPSTWLTAECWNDEPEPPQISTEEESPWTIPVSRRSAPYPDVSEHCRRHRVQLAV